MLEHFNIHTTTIKPPSTTAVITKNWTALISGSTSAKRKVALLQDGSQFAPIIDGQASSALAKSARASVSKVSHITSSTAQVRYSLYLGTKEALANQAGEAVKQTGTWKVSVASFCVLLELEKVTTPACPSA